MTPLALIISTSSSFAPARLAMALAKAGFRVDAVCLPRHSLRTTHVISQSFPYDWLSPIKSIKTAIESAKPDLVLPTDDLAAENLHELQIQENNRGAQGEFICRLIETSVGPFDSFQLAHARTPFLELANAQGVRAPKSMVVKSRGDLEKWAATYGFPMVLKADGTSGGEGVRIVGTLDEAESARRALEAPPLLARAIKRRLFDRDVALFRSSLLRKRRVINVQTFVAGREATTTVVCWKGEVLAGLHCEVVHKQNSSGPATVLRLINNSEMAAAAEKLVRHLQLSGFHGFDFMLETASGAPYLVEINPRTTQVGHLALGAGRDMPAALFAALTKSQLQISLPVTDRDTIALFPQEWLRNPKSPFLDSAGYHDVPWEEPELVLACLRRRRQQTAWHSPQRWIEVFSKHRNSRS